MAAGEPRTARDLLPVAERGPLDKLGSVQLEVLRARIAFALGRGGDAPALLLKAAKSLEPLDPIGARDTCLDAASAVWFADRFAKDTQLRDVALAARGLGGPDTPGAADLLLRAFAAVILHGYTAGAPWWQRAVAALRHGEFSGRDLGWLVLGTELAVTRWDEDAWDELSARDLRLAREAGAMDVLPIALTNRACAHVLAGELVAARSLVEEIEVICEATGIPVPPYAAVAAAVFGPPADADAAPRTVAVTNRPKDVDLIMADPTIVLVHGAFADASSCNRLYAELAGDGLMIKAPPNPLRGVTVDDAAYTTGCFRASDVSDNKASSAT